MRMAFMVVGLQPDAGSFVPPRFYLTPPTEPVTGSGAPGDRPGPFWTDLALRRIPRRCLPRSGPLAPALGRVASAILVAINAEIVALAGGAALVVCPPDVQPWRRQPEQYAQITVGQIAPGPGAAAGGGRAIGTPALTTILPDLDSRVRGYGRQVARGAGTARCCATITSGR